MVNLQKLALAASGIAAASAVSVSNSNSSLTLLYNNNLNFTDDANHASFVLLDAFNYADGATNCASIHESLLTSNFYSSTNHTDLLYQLNYVEYAGYVANSTNKSFWVHDGLLVVSTDGSNFTIKPNHVKTGKFPVLCTQTQPGSDVGGFSPVPSTSIVTVDSGNYYQGFRNKKAFWFTGVRYADFPGRFEYTKTLAGNGSVVPAQLIGSECLQYGSGSEDCFFLNIETPYIPKTNSTANLRPVMFWIHGGGFTAGQGAGNGGQFATREDLVTVTINYRLSTYGFLAVPGQLPGNYGLADQISALDWVIANIAKFGGDPNKITIAGQSAGAGSVRVMLGSPRTIGKFTGAVLMSGLGLDTSLGIGLGYGTTYSSYLTINASYAIAGQQIFTEANCTQKTLAKQIACLKAYTGDLSSFSTVARYPVQDGSVINTEQLILTHRNNNTAYVPVIFGVAIHDGASLGSYSHTCTTEVECVASNVGLSTSAAQQVVNSGLFPLYNTNNITADSFNVSARLNSDLAWRCAGQASAYAGTIGGALSASYFYESVRTYTEDAYNPFGVDITGTIEPGYPLGNPNTFYYRVHSSDIPNFFGVLHTYRDEADLLTVRLSSGYFGAFARSGQPNPTRKYLNVRGYNSTLTAVKEGGPWNVVSGKTGPVKHIDYPSKTANFNDQKQCDFLNSTVTYYIDGGN